LLEEPSNLYFGDLRKAVQVRMILNFYFSSYLSEWQNKLECLSFAHFQSNCYQYDITNKAKNTLAYFCSSVIDEEKSFVIFTTGLLQA
jgi:hypothetical protein